MRRLVPVSERAERSAVRYLLNTCVNGRLVYGGPARDSVVKQIALIEEFVEARA